MKKSVTDQASRVCAYDALIKVQIAQADSINASEITISKAVARGLHRELLSLKRALARPALAPYNRRLYNLFSEENMVLNQAMNRILS